MSDSDLDVYEEELYGDASDHSDTDHDIENHLYSQAHYASTLQISDTEVTTSNGEKQVYPEIQVGTASCILGVHPPPKQANNKKTFHAVVGEDGEQWDLDDVDMAADTPKRSSARYYTKFLPNIFCRNCDKKGHLQKDCQEPKKLPICFLCGHAGHLRNGCPNDLCYNCLKPGHISKECPEPFVKFWKIARQSCTRCGFFGHLKKSCPDVWRQYHVTTVPDVVVKPKNKNGRNARRFCYNCGSSKHFGEDCNEERFSKRAVYSQFIGNYDRKCNSSKEVQEGKKERKAKKSIATENGKSVSCEENLKKTEKGDKIKTSEKESLQRNTNNTNTSSCSSNREIQQSRGHNNPDSDEKYIVVEEWKEPCQQQTGDEKKTSNLKSKLVKSARGFVSKRFSMATDLNIDKESDDEILPRKKRRTNSEVVATDTQHKNLNKSISNMIASVVRKFSKGESVSDDSKGTSKKNDRVANGDETRDTCQTNPVGTNSNPFVENMDFISLSSKETKAVNNNTIAKKRASVNNDDDRKQNVTKERRRRKVNGDADYRTLKVYTLFSSDDESDTCDLTTRLKSQRSSPDINIDIDSLHDELNEVEEDLRMTLNRSRQHHAASRDQVGRQHHEASRDQVDLTSYDPKEVITKDLIGYNLNASTIQTRHVQKAIVMVDPQSFNELSVPRYSKEEKKWIRNRLKHQGQKQAKKRRRIAEETVRTNGVMHLSEKFLSKAESKMSGKRKGNPRRNKHLTDLKKSPSDKRLSQWRWRKGRSENMK